MNQNNIYIQLEYMDWKKLIIQRNQLSELIGISDIKYTESINTALAIIEQLLIYQNYGESE